MGRLYTEQLLTFLFSTVNEQVTLNLKTRKRFLSIRSQVEDLLLKLLRF